MGSFKDNLKIQFGGLFLGIQEILYKIKTWFELLPKWERVLIYTLLIILIPGYFLTRYGTELYFNYYYQRESLVAHASFNNPEKLQQSKVSLIKNSSGTVSAYAVVNNPNLDLALENLSYTFSFFNNSDEEVYTTTGRTYILNNQKKWLVVPKVLSSENISTAKLTIEDPNWQKKLNLPEVDLKMSEPYVYEQVNPLATITEGTVVNNSPYKVKQASLVLVLYNLQNQVVAITTREEFALDPYERRAYKIQWPGVYQVDVSRVGLEAYTNSLSPDNLIIESNAGISNLIDTK